MITKLYKNNLPTGWALATIKDITKVVEKQSSETEPSKEFFYIDIASIDNTLKKITEPKEYTWKEAPSRAKQVVKANDIVFSTVRPYLMNIALVPGYLDRQLASTGFCIIRAHREVHYKLLFYFTLSRDFVKSLSDLQRGTSYPAVRDKDILSQSFPLPPASEQQRIVDKIEELFSDLDDGVESLKKAQQQLKVYRQAVLKWAFEGKLTAEWREEQRQLGKLESADVLLEKIKEEREERNRETLEAWIKQVENWEKSKKDSKAPRKPPVLKEISFLGEDDTQDLPNTPKQWLYIHAEGVSDFITKGTTPKKGELFASAGEVPFIKVYNLTHYGNLNFSIKPTFVSRSTHELFLRRSQVLPEDVLLNIVGPPLGKVAIVPDTFPEWNINQAIARYRTFDILFHKYFCYYLLSQNTVRRMSQRAKATAGQFNLTLEICRNLEIPICSTAEQMQIVGEIESRLSICDHIQANITTNLEKTEALRQSILKQAFEGKLVPQDPNDEPATVLLERIRAEKALKTTSKKEQRRPGKTRKKSKHPDEQLALGDI